MIYWKKHEPVKSLWTDSLQLISLLPPRPPTRVFQTHTVCNGIFLASHITPGLPYILFSPFMGKIVDLALGKG